VRFCLYHPYNIGLGCPNSARCKKDFGVAWLELLALARACARCFFAGLAPPKFSDAIELLLALRLEQCCCYWALVWALACVGAYRALLAACWK
jgi:hypothetical protein